LLDRSLLLRKLQGFVARRRPPEPNANALAHEVVRAYTANVDVVEALARAYGFRVIYVWQSSLHGTRKRLTPYEQYLMSEIEGDGFQRRVKQIHDLVPEMLDSAMATH